MCFFHSKPQWLLHELTWNLQAIAGWLCWLKRHLETGCSPRLKALFMNEEFALTLFYFVPSLRGTMYKLQILTWLCVLPDFNSNLPHCMRMLQNRCLCWNLQRSAVFLPMAQSSVSSWPCLGRSFFCWTAPDEIWDRSCTSWDDYLPPEFSRYWYYLIYFQLDWWSQKKSHWYPIGIPKKPENIPIPMQYIKLLDTLWNPVLPGLSSWLHSSSSWTWPGATSFTDLLRKSIGDPYCRIYQTRIG